MQSIASPHPIVATSHCPATTPAALRAGSIHRRGFPWHWLFITYGVAVTLSALFVLALLLSFRMGGEARTLRHAVFAATPGEWKPEFEFGVGRLPAFFARNGFQLVDHHLDLPPEALAGIAAFRSADVGIYHRPSSAPALPLAETMVHVDAAMAERDWEPLVSVQEKDESIRIFVPRSLSRLEDMRACVFVMEQDELIIVSARVDLEPLIGLIQAKLPARLLDR